ncbi:MAG: UDP-N-acetylglucosamine 1-carboxyvinyltransferase [Rhodospirillaceae bacterium]|jgi:UDP-N-acetylglucosamine 1-carboxyvinyltransferase|nr:UDP-N-acetylglucosamine 1-carboxyvinyltransferase [Rhodospirillaceae bacterium]
MDKIRIVGGTPLRGVINIGGAKNSALALMSACLLTDDILLLSNLSYLVDIVTMTSLLKHHGVSISLSNNNTSLTSHTLELNANKITNTTAPYDLVRKMRASILVLGPLLARCNQVKVSLPGGCAIGTRPVNLHLKALETMGAKIDVQGGYIIASVPSGRLIGSEIIFPHITVGGTENILMAASLADGKTIITNAAREPEVCDLANCLVAMGAKIVGIGTSTLHIEGVDRLYGAQYSIIPDRIETGTYAIAAAITRGNIELIGARRDTIQSVEKVLIESGVEISETPLGIRVNAYDRRIVGVDIMTEPYPGFPTDMQAQLMALMTTAEGASMITETLFENRFMHVPELLRMGAKINVHGSSAIIRGVQKLSGAPVMATDLRASGSLVLAGLIADGETIINRIYHLDRGYERVEEKLAACGANINRIKDSS